MGCFYFGFSALFPDVVNCMQTDNIELKKLVYLYLMNYAKSQPDMAIMAVNTFVRVCKLSFVNIICEIVIKCHKYDIIIIIQIFIQD